MDTDNQMSALVGRRIHASAANSSDTRNLHEHEPKVASGTQQNLLNSTTYCESEPRSCWRALCDSILVPTLLSLAVICQGQ
jgi:hypothetical protein